MVTQTSLTTAGAAVSDPRRWAILERTKSKACFYTIPLLNMLVQERLPNLWISKMYVFATYCLNTV